MAPGDSSEAIYISSSGNRKGFSFSGELKEAIFGKKILNLPFPKTWEEKNIQKNYDIYNQYTLNNYKFRGPDFSEGVDVIIGGCSFTFGIGVPDDGTWADQYSRKTGHSYVNISAPGASIEWIIENVYRYIDTFGKPDKGILLLLPDLLRQEVVVDSVQNKTLEIEINDFVPQYYDSEDDKTYLGTYMFAGHEIPNLIKRPFPIEYTTLGKESIKRNVIKIKDFERYCKASNINLYWSSWSDATVWLYTDLPDGYRSDSYFDLHGLAHWKSHFYKLEKTELDPEGIADYRIVHDPSNLECSQKKNEAGTCVCFSTCHFELEKDFPLSFHLGTDRLKAGVNNAHYGVHRLIHIAEDFIELTKDW